MEGTTENKRASVLPVVTNKVAAKIETDGNPRLACCLYIAPLDKFMIFTIGNPKEF